MAVLAGLADAITAGNGALPQEARTPDEGEVHHTSNAYWPYAQQCLEGVHPAIVSILLMRITPSITAALSPMICLCQVIELPVDACRQNAATQSRA